MDSLREALLVVVRKHDFNAHYSTEQFNMAFDTLRSSFTPDEISSGELKLIEPRGESELREALEKIADPNTTITERCEKSDELVTFPLDMWWSREIARQALATPSVDRAKYLLDEIYAGVSTAIWSYVAAIKDGDLERASQLKVGRIDPGMATISQFTEGDIHEYERCTKCKKVLSEGEPVTPFDEELLEVCASCSGDTETPYVHSKIDHAEAFFRAAEALKEIEPQAEQAYEHATQSAPVSGLVREAAQKVLEWLEDPQMSTWNYMEGTYFYRDRDKHIEALKSALASRDEWRPEVKAFADLMETGLRERDAITSKSSWKSCNPKDLREGMEVYIRQMDEHARMGVSKAQCGLDTAEVAIFAMMIADVCGALTTPPTSQERKS